MTRVTYASYRPRWSHVRKSCYMITYAKLVIKPKCKMCLECCGLLVSSTNNVVFRPAIVTILRSILLYHTCKTFQNPTTKLKVTLLTKYDESWLFNINTNHVQNDENMPYASVHKSRTSFLLFFPQTDVATVDLTADTV